MVICKADAAKHIKRRLFEDAILVDCEGVSFLACETWFVH